VSSVLEACIKTLLGVATAFFLLVALYTAGPELETRWAPVVAKMEIVTAVAFPNGRSEIYVRFNKLRNCKYLGMAWYAGERNVPGFRRVPFVLVPQTGEKPNPTRPVGDQIAGPWIVDMPITELKGNSFVELFHECHVLWQSRTEFYP